MVVIDKGHGSNHERLYGLQAGVVQAVTNQVAKGLGPVFVPLSADEPVKALQQIGIQRNSRSDQTHAELPQGADENSTSPTKRNTTQDHLSGNGVTLHKIR